MCPQCLTPWKCNGPHESLPTMVYPEWPMVRRTNRAAEMAKCDYIGWVADDNRFETPGWDEQVVKFLGQKAGGVVYGNDIISPGSKPSHVFMDARIPRALGWFLHPELRSTFFDDVWEQIGRGLGTLRYLPTVRINHLYTPKNNAADFAHDMAVYQRWMRHDLDDDLARIRRELKGAIRSKRVPVTRQEEVAVESAHQEAGSGEREIQAAI